MASIAIMVGGAMQCLVNATAFVGGSYLARFLSGGGKAVITEEERKRHVLAVEREIEKYQAAYEKY